MPGKLIDKLLLFALFGAALWFFGNLYEGIVIAPNLLANSFQKAQHWQGFFTGSNPVFFYIPFVPLSSLVLGLLYVKMPEHLVALKRLLKPACLFQAAAYALSVYIITQINLPLFFGDLDTHAGELHTKAVLWNVLNALRLVLTGAALTFVFKAYRQMPSKPGR